MSRVGLQVAIVLSLIALFSEQGSANFWREPALPDDPNDEYYEQFQKVPPVNKTAIKLMENFLRIGRRNGFGGRRGRSIIKEDIVIVMDSSGSIGNCEFTKGKKALKHMLNLASTNPQYNSMYAAVTYSSGVTVDFNFLPAFSASSNIMQATYSGGGTNTAGGLAEAMTLFDDASSGRRQNSKKTVLLVTDGQSNNKDSTVAKAKELKRYGIEIFVVGVGSYINGIDEMVKVSSLPPHRYLFRVKTLSSLFDVVRLMIKEVRGESHLPQYEPPC